MPVDSCYLSVPCAPSPTCMSPARSWTVTRYQTEWMPRECAAPNMTVISPEPSSPAVRNTRRSTLSATIPLESNFVKTSQFNEHATTFGCFPHELNVHQYGEKKIILRFFTICILQFHRMNQFLIKLSKPSHQNAFLATEGTEVAFGFGWHKIMNSFKIDLLKVFLANMKTAYETR